MARKPKPKPEVQAETTTDEGLPPEAPETDTSPETVEPEMTAYEKAVAFEPAKWDDLPEDHEVRRIYVALNGHIRAYAKR